MTRLLLIGGGHAHIEVLRRFAGSPPAAMTLCLATPAPALTYSGMVPGVIAGHYALADAQIDLAHLAVGAGARLALASVAALDPVARRATLSNGAVEAFDVASLDVGAVPAAGFPGARDHAIAVRPLEVLVAAVDALRAAAQGGVAPRIAVVGGGAAGIELDCLNTTLGSPPNMLRLASSENHTPMIMLVNEEFGVVPPNLGGDLNPRVKADLAFGETPSGGAIFATGSIAWCGSLSHNGYDNNVARITANVLKRFLDPEPFPTR